MGLLLFLIIGGSGLAPGIMAAGWVPILKDPVLTLLPCSLQSQPRQLPLYQPPQSPIPRQLWYVPCNWI